MSCNIIYNDFHIDFLCPFSSSFKCVFTNLSLLYYKIYTMVIFYYINCTYSLKIHLNLSTELDSSKQINYPALSNHVIISSRPVLSPSQYFSRLSILLTSSQLLNLLVLFFNQYYLYFRIEILQFVAFLFLFLSEIWIIPV